MNHICYIGPCDLKISPPLLQVFVDNVDFLKELEWPKCKIWLNPRKLQFWLYIVEWPAAKPLDMIQGSYNFFCSA